MRRDLFERLWQRLLRWLKIRATKAPQPEEAEPLAAKDFRSGDVRHIIGTQIPYDENLLERARIQWQFGDWDSLAKLEHDAIQNNPFREKLALLAAAGRLQTSKTNDAQKYIRLARNWGCSERLIKQILVAGVHNSLGRAAILAGREQKGSDHFHQAIATGAPNSEARLLTKARIQEQKRQIYSKVIADSNKVE